MPTPTWEYEFNKDGKKSLLINTSGLTKVQSLLGNAEYFSKDKPCKLKFENDPISSKRDGVSPLSTNLNSFREFGLIPEDNQSDLLSSMKQHKIIE